MTDWLFGQQNNIPIVYAVQSGGMKMTFPAYFNGDLEMALDAEHFSLLFRASQTKTTFEGYLKAFKSDKFNDKNVQKVK